MPGAQLCGEVVLGPAAKLSVPHQPVGVSVEVGVRGTGQVS